MMHWRSRSTPPRDQLASPFAVILEGFCLAAEALGAALVDHEGETVDYYGRLDPFVIKVAAAEWRLILGLLAEAHGPLCSNTEEVLIRARSVSFALVPLAAGYALVAALPHRSFSLSRRALSICAARLSEEAGLETPAYFRPALERWSPVTVRVAPGDALRPVALFRDAAWHPFQVLGRYEDRDAGVRALGYRGRLDNAEELTLVRERRGIWYLDALQ